MKKTKSSTCCTTTPRCSRAARRPTRWSCTRRCASRREFEPLLVARIGPNVASARTSAPGRAVQRGGRRPEPVLLVHRDERLRLLHDDVARQGASTPATSPTSSRHTSPTSCTSSTRCSSGSTSCPPSRRLLPDVPIFYTLHEYLPICHRDGQMLRTNGELCTHASPRRCNECFPAIPPQDFFLRERFIKSHLEHVDMFLAPSQFLLERYVDWGIPRDRIRFEDYGRTRQHHIVPDVPPPRRGAQPHRLLRAAELLQGRRRADGGDDAAGRRRRRRAPDAARREPRAAAAALPGRAERAARGHRPGPAQRHPGGEVRARRPPAPDGRDRLGGRAVALVGELAARDPGGVPAQPSRDLQRHRRHGREGRRRRQRPALPRRRSAQPRAGAARLRWPPRACGSRCERASPTSTTWTSHVASLRAMYREQLERRAPRPRALPDERAGRACRYAAWLGSRAILLAVPLDGHGRATSRHRWRCPTGDRARRGGDAATATTAAAACWSSGACRPARGAAGQAVQVTVRSRRRGAVRAGARPCARRSRGCAP